MRRKGLLLAVLAAVAAAAVIGGLAAIAFDPGGSPTAKPSGKETRLRVQPHEDRVACSADKQAVDIYLDDLEARPAPGNEGVNLGMAAFEFTLRFDPSILRLESAGDVEIGAILTSPGAAGGRRAFIPGPVTFDNLDGYVIFGGVGIPQGGASPTEAEGPDPVARGEPILLATLRFQTVGEGTSPLAFYRQGEPGPMIPAPDTGVADLQIRTYTPLVLENSSLTVTAGDCAPAPAVTPRPTQALPTPFPTRTPIVVPTPQQLTPVPAADAGRPDCPQGWNAYRDPDDHFSFCYPADLDIVTSRIARRELGGVSVNLGAPTDPKEPLSRNRVFMALGWGVDPVFNPTLQLAELCSFAPLLGRQETSVPVRVQIAGRTAVGCSATGADDVSGPPVQVLLLQIPVDPAGAPDDGYVKLKISYIGPDIGTVQAQGRSILDTLVIPER